MTGLAVYLAALALSAQPAAKPGSFVLVEPGRAPAPILVAGAELEQRRALAEELAQWLERICGQRPAVLTAPPWQPAIYLGTPDDFPTLGLGALKQLGPEGLLLRSSPARLLVVAATPAGLEDAVYTLLEQLGCRWFFPHPAWHVIPRQAALKLQIDLKLRPAFKQREIWYEWGGSVPASSREQFAAWLRYNRQGGHFQFSCGHNYAGLVPPSLFAQHPEYFAEVEGKRQPTQLCTSNPAVIALAAEAVLQRFRHNPSLNMVSVEPNDGGGYCECPRCRALGTISDRVFYFANEIVKRVRREFPDKWVGLYAYAYHSDPPHFRLEPGVYVQVTTGFRYTKLSFDEQVAAFRRLGATVGVYDYFSVYPWDFDLPGRAKASRLFELAAALRHYADLGLSTYSAESSCNWGPCGPGYWMAAHLMWQPQLDPHRLLADFCTRAFGKAAEPMQRLYERWARGELFTLRNLKLALQDLRQARALEPDPAVRARLEQVGMYLHYLHLWRQYERLSARGEFGQLVVPPEQVLASGEAWVRWCRRLTDTGLIAVFPTLFTEWFDSRLASLLKIEGAKEKAEQWRQAPTQMPSSEEIATAVEADLGALAGLQAVEIVGRRFSDQLLPLAQIRPGSLAAWTNAPRSPLYVEKGLHYFLGRRGEKLALPLRPQPGQALQGHWRVTYVPTGETVAEGDVRAAKDEPATLTFLLPREGLYALDPGTSFWHVAEVDWAGRPFAVRADASAPLQLWTPRPDQPLYFYVPPGTRTFVVSLLEGGWPGWRVIIRDATGQTIVDDKDLRAGDDISVVVPPGHAGQVWSLGFSALRGCIALHDVPPYLAPHPQDLLVPRECVQ
jgi:hypothetical protein